MALGRTTAEAVEPATLAKANGLVTAVGLPARVNPALMHMKEPVEAGLVGEVMAVHVSLMREGVLSRPSHRTWQRDAELGANTLTIANSHTVDAMRFVTGDFLRLFAVLATQAKQLLDTGTNTLLDVTSPDNVLLSGQLANGRRGLGPHRRHSVRWQWLSHGDLRPRLRIAVWRRAGRC
jgi:predicted dehydrogenase